MTQCMKFVFSFSYVLVMLGSLGMMVYATKYGFATNSDEYRLSRKKFMGLNGAQMWRVSWVLILLGTFGQLIAFLIS
jgi:hypothetical protein